MLDVAHALLYGQQIRVRSLGCCGADLLVRASGTSCRLASCLAASAGTVCVTQVDQVYRTGTTQADGAGKQQLINGI